MNSAPPIDVVQGHRWFAAAMFNRTWELLEKPDRTAVDDELMISACRASLYHWQQRPDCQPQNLSIGYWLLSRVHSVLHQPQEALRAAELCLQYSVNEPPFFLGYAYEALSRASMVAGRSDDHQRYLAEAKRCSEQVENPEERELLENDLRSLEPLESA